MAQSKSLICPFYVSFPEGIMSSWNVIYGCFIKPYPPWLHQVSRCVVAGLLVSPYLQLSHDFPHVSTVSHKMVIPPIKSGWWVSHPSEKYESQLGWWNSQLNGKIIQMFQTTNQIMFAIHITWHHCLILGKSCQNGFVWRIPSGNLTVCYWKWHI